MRFGTLAGRGGPAESAGVPIGVRPGLVRVSVGVETVENLMEYLAHELG